RNDLGLMMLTAPDNPTNNPAYSAFAQAGHITNSRPSLSVYRDVNGDGQAALLWAYQDASAPDPKPIHFDALKIRGPGRTNVEVSSPNLPYDACMVWLDANGDGLIDVVYPTQGKTYVNVGGDFVQSAATFTPLSLKCDDPKFDPGLRVADYNGDGKQDILLLGPLYGTRMTVLVASADGTNPPFTHVAVTDSSAAGTFPGLAAYGTSCDASFTRVLDVNGDGNPDLIQLGANGQIVVNRASFMAPEIMWNATDGMGKSTTHFH